MTQASLPVPDLLGTMRLPREVHVGERVRARLPEAVRALGSTALFVVDPFLLGSRVLEEIVYHVRTILNAEACVLMLKEGNHLVLKAIKGLDPSQHQTRIAVGEGPSGIAVQTGQTLTVQYTGWLWDGTKFDSSWSTGSPATFKLDTGSVIAGWVEGLTGQTIGSQVLLVIPPAEGYGDKAQGSIPANSTLVFVIDILATQHVAAG